MKIQDKVVVVTGGGNGIGRALCRRFAAEGARGVVVADLDAEGAEMEAKEIGGGGIDVPTDVSSEAGIVRLVAQTIEAYGPIDLFCSHAGTGGIAGWAEDANGEWPQ